MRKINIKLPSERELGVSGISNYELRKFIGASGVKQADLFFSSDMFKEKGLHLIRNMEEIDINEYFTSVISGLSKKLYEQDPIYFDFIKTQFEKKGIDKIGILNAHGCMAVLNSEKEPQWCYSENGNPRSIQKWIDKRGQEYNSIFLYLCNTEPQKAIVKTSNPILFASDSNIKSASYISQRVNMDCISEGNFYMILPKTGEVNSYCLEKELEKFAEDD